MVREDFLVPQDMYVKYKVHIGLREKSRYMLDNYVFKVKENGVAVFDIKKIDERIRDAINLISQYNPSDVVVADRRAEMYRALNLMKENIGVSVISGRYLPGTFTNPQYEFFFEPDVVLVLDPFENKNIIKDAASVNKPVIAFLNSDGTPEYVDLVIPGNNRAIPSVVFLVWLLTRELALAWGENI